MRILKPGTRVFPWPTIRIVVVGVLLISGGATLSACGIKPERLSPPNGAPTSTFPRPYPH